MSKSLLIIGAGREQVPAYELAHQKGLTVVGTDMDPAAPGLAIADYALIASTRNVTETLDVVGAFAANHKIDGVMTIANDVPLTVSRVGEALGLPVAPSEAVSKLTDKVVMKTHFVDHGVPTPAFASVSTMEEFARGLGKIGFPAIIKPSDGRGSLGVLYMQEHSDLDHAFDHAMACCGNGKLILEAFVPGPQLSVEGMFVGDRYHAVAFADRNYSNLPLTAPYIVEDGGCIPSRYEGETLEQIGALIEAGALSLGLKTGTVKADIVITEDGQPMIIELAGRLSGNYLATHHIPAAYGIDLVGALIDLSLGKQPDARKLEPRWKRYFGVRYFFPPPGLVSAIYGEDSVRNHPDIEMFEMYIKPGDLQPPVDRHGARAGTLMVRGASWQAATDLAETLVASISFEIGEAR